MERRLARQNYSELFLAYRLRGVSDKFNVVRRGQRLLTRALLALASLLRHELAYPTCRVESLLSLVRWQQ